MLDYRVSYALESSDTWTVASEQVTHKMDYTMTGLTAGTTYKFRVEARNMLYFSDASDSVSILCAMAPQTPAMPTSENSLDQVNIYWSAPATNGLAISSY